MLMLFHGFLICCSLDSAEETSFAVEEGDVVVLGTDGLFDNLTEKQMIDEVSKLKVKGKQREFNSA